MLELLYSRPSSNLGANQFRFPATPTPRFQYPATYLHHWWKEDVPQILLKHYPVIPILGRHVGLEKHIKLPTVRLVDQSSICQLLMLPTT